MKYVPVCQKADITWFKIYFFRQAFVKTSQYYPQHRGWCCPMQPVDRPLGARLPQATAEACTSQCRGQRGRWSYCSFRAMITIVQLSCTLGKSLSRFGWARQALLGEVERQDSLTLGFPPLIINHSDDYWEREKSPTLWWTWWSDIRDTWTGWSYHLDNGW